MNATAVAHPNIALVKYWGKRDTSRNVPAVGSISITLDTLTTTTSVSLDRDTREDVFILDGAPGGGQSARVTRCLDLIRQHTTGGQHARVESTNSFPTAAGLASSASGFAALVVAADRALESGLDRATLARYARRCSGSAARSLYGGFVELELSPPGHRPETSVRTILEPQEWPLAVVIAVTSEEQKAVSSTAGMERSARTSPYFRAWVETATEDLTAARGAIASRDFEALADISEYSCLKMHALMLASRPGLLYWNAATVRCLHHIRDLRGRGEPVFFTVDAGPQVKAVCLPQAAPRVAEELGALPGVTSVLVTGLGDGARIVEP